jgi:selenide,water dikinase
MGGRPITALNIVGFPDEALDVSVLGEILRGGADKARDAGIAPVGGHTIKTDEPIYGLAVTGVVHPDRIVSNAGGRPGDLLVLSKPIGLGIISTAAKQDRDSLDAIRDAINVMTTLNASACEAMCEVGVHAATDVTGFGLLGHLRNVAKASGLSARIWVDEVPVLEQAWEYVRAGIAPGGTHANWRFLNDWASYADDVDKAAQLTLCDAQTSGGLLMAVAPEKADRLVDGLCSRGALCASVVGRLEEGEPGRMRIVRRPDAP